MTRRPVVLILTDGYPPATRGGSLRAVSALTAQLSETIDFRILARDHDVVTGTRWPVPSSDDWIEVDGVRVRYCSRKQMSASRLRDHIREIAPDTIYANSLFATPVQWLLWLRRAGLLPAHRLILAPEGEFSPGARQQKAFKKRAYLTVAKRWDLYRDVTWKAASAIEREDIIREMPGAQVKLVPSLREATENRSADAAGPAKVAGQCRLLFLSRIAQVKNLAGAIELVTGAPPGTHLSIVGPIDDTAYWSKCQDMIGALPAGVSVSYDGEVAPSDVASAYAGAHALLLPTLGENHSFVIEDALRFGCPLLISDRTPWSAIVEQGAGYVIPLSESSQWHAAIRAINEMNNADWMELRRRSIAIFQTLSGGRAEDYCELFRT